jgi:flagellar motor protein MotB
MHDEAEGCAGDAEESPWISFSDAMAALLFIFITTTFWFMVQLLEIRARLTTQAEEKAEELRRLTGAETAAQALIGDVKLCLEQQAEGSLRIRPVVDLNSRTLSIYLEPEAGTGGEWFSVCSAAVTRDADQALETMRRCLADEVPALTDTYSVTLVLEGHTDSRATGGACAAKFPSNWELSGARAGAALRRLFCDDGKCGAGAETQAGVLRSLAEDGTKLKVVAAGRAESVPAWSALCDPTWPGATVNPTLDEAVCAGLASGPAGRQEAATLIRAQGARDRQVTVDQALIAWANAAECLSKPSKDIKERCEERLGRLRRVDLRVDLKPRLPMAESSTVTPI